MCDRFINIFTPAILFPFLSKRWSINSNTHSYLELMHIPPPTPDLAGIPTFIANSPDASYMPHVTIKVLTILDTSFTYYLFHHSLYQYHKIARFIAILAKSTASISKEHCLKYKSNTSSTSPSINPSILKKICHCSISISHSPSFDSTHHFILNHPPPPCSLTHSPPAPVSRGLPYSTCRWWWTSMHTAGPPNSSTARGHSFPTDNCSRRSASQQPSSADLGLTLPWTTGAPQKDQQPDTHLATGSRSRGDSAARDRFGPRDAGQYGPGQRPIRLWDPAADDSSARRSWAAEQPAPGVRDRHDTALAPSPGRRPLDHRERRGERHGADLEPGFSVNCPARPGSERAVSARLMATLPVDDATRRLLATAAGDGYVRL